MSQAKMKIKPEGDVAGASNCENPAVGHEQVIAYIVGDMSVDTHRDFVAHLVECKSCLESVLLWRMAQELVKAEDQAGAVVHTARG